MAEGRPSSSDAARLEDEVTALRHASRRLESELEQAREKLEAVKLECERLERRADWYRSELEKVQAHLTRILASRVFRYSRLPRRIWYKLKGSG